MHRLASAYREGRTAYPDEPNPHQDDPVAARMWRLGWQRTRDGLTHAPPNETK